MNIDDLVISEKELDLDYYYHAYDMKNMESILNNGLLCAFLRGKKGKGHNGPFYVSVSKKENYRSLYTVYGLYSSYGWPMFIIDKDVKTFKVRNGYKYTFLANTPIPLRSCPYNGEYQSFLKIEPEKIIGLRMPNLSDFDSINKLKEMSLILKNMKKDLPIYDYSMESNGIIRELDQEKILKLK